MSDVRDWSITASANNTIALGGWPEGMAPSAVNDQARDNLSALARWFAELNGSRTSTYAAGVFTVHVDSSPATAAHLSLLAFRSPNANSGTASLQVIGDSGAGTALTTYPIKQNNAHLTGNEMRTGQLNLVLFNALSAHYELFNSVTPGTQAGRQLINHSTTASMIAALGIGTLAAAWLDKSSTASMQLALDISPQGANVMNQSSTASMQGALGIGTLGQQWLGMSSTASMVGAVGAATRALDNLEGISINTPLLPSANGSIDFGQDVLRWDTVFADKIKFPKGSIITGHFAIKFPSTQDASTNANTLDDYEEGTWTPVLSDGTNDATLGVAYGSYVKTGNHVYTSFRIVVTSKGSMSGSLVVKGLPFVSNATTYGYSYACGQCANVNITIRMSICAAVTGSSSQIDLKLWDSATGNTNLLDTEITDSSTLHMSGFFMV